MHRTDTPPPPAPHLPGLIRDPQGLLHHLDQIVRTWTVPLLAAALACVAAYAGAGLLTRARRNNAFADRARVIEISAPPEAALSGGEALWANLLGLHRPRYARLLHGQPHLGFEYCFTGDGHCIRLWVPAAIPPGLVEHAIEAAWPGARALPLEDPSPPLPLTGVEATGGRLVPARTEAIPIRTKHEQDPLRALFGAVSDLQPGEAACVQILTRPASPRRARKLRATLNALLGKPTGTTGLKTAFFDAITPGSGGSHRPTGGQAPWRDPRTDADARAAASKLAGPLWETVVRYGAAAPARRANATGRARGLAHGAASAMGAYAERNHLRRRRLRHPARILAARAFGRGALYSVPELAALAHLPADLVVPGLARAGARPVPPSVRIPSAGTASQPVRVLGDSDAGPARAVAIPVADARHHLHVIGATGSGKSTLLGNLVLDDVAAGRGAVVIDPKGDLVADLLDRLPAQAAARTVLFDPEDCADPPRINMFDGAEPDVTVDNLVGIFKRIYSGFWGPRTDDLLRAACLTLVTACHKNPGLGVPTLAHVPGLLTSDAARRRYVSALNEREHAVLKTFWDWYEQMSPPSRAYATAPLLNKLRAFLLRDFVLKTVATGATSIDMGKILDGGLCLVRLPKGVLGDETVRLLGSFIVAKVWQAAAARLSGGPAAARALIEDAIAPLTANPPYRDRILEIRRDYDIRYDATSKDEIISLVEVPREERAASIVQSWHGYLEQHRDEITAIQVLTETRGGGRGALAQLSELAARIHRPPHAWTPEIIWDAYETLHQAAALPGENAQIPDLVSLIRYELGFDTELKPYRSVIEERFAGWLLRQQQAGAQFTADQMWWLEQIRDTIAIGVGITVDDVKGVPFTERGGQAGLIKDFGSRDRARALIIELDRELA
jgi:hypothetical protein